MGSAHYTPVIAQKTAREDDFTFPLEWKSISSLCSRLHTTSEQIFEQ